MAFKPLSPQLVRELILAQGDRFFRVTFVKRTDGQLRTMLARRGIAPAKPVLKPGKRAEEDLITDCITVFEVGKGYKRIPIDRVLEVAAAGEVTKA